MADTNPYMPSATPTGQTGTNPAAPDYKNQAAQLYQQNMGRAGDQAGIDYWAGQLAGGADPTQVAQNFKTSAQGVYSDYKSNPSQYDAQNPGLSTNFKNDPGMAQSSGVGTPGITAPPNLPNGAPDYMNLANQQSLFNIQNAQATSAMNNPNFYGPGGSQVRTRNADGSYNVTQTLNPQIQANYDASNKLQGDLLNKSNSLAGNNLSYSGVGQTPTFDTSGRPALGGFDTSGVSAIPTADQGNLDKTRDSVYAQQTQYLDPQFQQAQGDLESKLANQGIMPGSELYARETGNLAQQKQKAYESARNSAIQAGGAEQSRLFGLGLQANQAGQSNALNQFNTGLQAHNTGTNDALSNFNTGLQSRQQGVSEQNTLHNSQYNDLASLKNGSQIALPTYQGQSSTSIPGVDFLNAANMGYNANLGISNADAAKSQNNLNNLFGLGNLAVQSGLPSTIWDWMKQNNSSAAVNPTTFDPSIYS